MMDGAVKRFAKTGFLRRLASNRSGIALTEFAMALPVLCALCITGVETANYVTANMRVSQIALSVADNSGRIRDSIDEAEVDSIMIGARVAGESIAFGENGRVILSMIEVNGLTGANAGQRITWQRCFGMKNSPSSFGAEGAGSTDSTFSAGFGPPTNRIAATPGNGVMFVEAVYDYRPIFSVAQSMINGLGGRTMRYTAAFPVRERDNNALTNGFNLPDTQRRLCSRRSAT